MASPVKPLTQPAAAPATRAKSGTDLIRIEGGEALNGDIGISGAKNSALILMCAALLTEDTMRFTNMPTTLRDIATLTKVLESLGATIATGPEGTMAIQARNIKSTKADYDLVKEMRASFLVMGPLLTRFKEATVSMPGGCAIGTRPIDFHLMGFEAMGAQITLEEGYVRVTAPGGLKGADITFPRVSVGATENIMMAAALASGVTHIFNAACEPEIVDLGRCLIAMGAKIEGLGTSTITVTGVPSLRGAMHQVVADRIETGTYMIAVAMAGGKVRLKNASAEHLQALVGPLKTAGVRIEEDDGDVIVERAGPLKEGTNIVTEVHPGFPTDLQAQFMTLLTQCRNGGTITETIWENRFMHVPELARMGAKIAIDGNTATIAGAQNLTGARVMATDLRASAALVLAALVAKGTTTIDRIYHLDRGYENLEVKLKACGAKIERIPAGAP
ncbi:MAG: UDP-N-acetylglucosamine 1-carboxyvinyltransferase [Micavibrio aeruginosavorus]|uniref:UDP-N-acetylglucosamine 1-carboxyvinyltransferase n=1 Tax=Micavibrio aeruginosavorus TaxID=349221 RepID=A0A7T5R3Q5_9BACT|nr:MAG: UDP-N-acetylglucosamine 1-carboxyvinyltransferase [Micavibrio aeruginosavorus]